MGIKQLLPLLLLLFLCASGWWIYTDVQIPPFHPKELYSAIPSADSSDPLPQELVQTLHQPFHLIGEGAQMYAFRSADGKSVIKVFKARHFPHGSLLQRWRRLHCSKEEMRHAQKRWGEKFADTCNRYLMAFKDLKEETGLTYLHFEKTSGLPLSTTLLDANKKPYPVDLNNHPFIVQRYAQLVPDYLKTLVDAKQMDLAQTAISSLKELFLHRTQKGYVDDRQSLRINYGFINGKAVQIDVGKIKKVELTPVQTEEVLIRLDQRVNQWIHCYFPMLDP